MADIELIPAVRNSLFWGSWRAENGQKRSFTKSFIHWILVYKKDQYSKLINSMPLFDMDQLTSDTQMN